MAPKLYVLYENPRDYPGMFVLRLWRGSEPDRQPLIVTRQLVTAMCALPKNVKPLGRQYGDDPAIKDVWIAA